VARRFGYTLLGWCLVLVPPTGSARADDPRNPPEGTFADRWYAVMLMGSKAGYMHTTMTRHGEEIRSLVETRMRVGRGGQPITMSVTLAARETIDGTPLAFESAVDASLMRITYKGRIRNGKVTVTSTQLGQQQVRTYSLPKDAKLTWGAYLETLEHGLEPGTSYRLNLYDPTMSPDTAVPVVVKVIKKETIDLFGRKLEATRLESTMAMPSAMGTLNMKTVTWVDDRGEALRMRMQVIQFPVEMVQCAKAYALAEADPPELFLDTLIPSDRPIRRDAARKIVFRLSVQGGGDMPTLPTTGMQKPTPNADGSLTLTVTRQDHRALRAAKPTATAKAMLEYLRPSAYLNCDDPAVVKLARQVAPNETNPYVIADALRRFVSRHIQQKTLNVGFATASEVARSREGDCSEHAVLLAALARARGLPSRVLGGLVFCERLGGRRNVFGYHMWTEVYLAGQWVDLDPAQNQTDCDPTHIALAVSSLDDKGLPDVALSLLNVIKRLKIETIEVH